MCTFSYGKGLVKFSVTRRALLSQVSQSVTHVRQRATSVRPQGRPLGLVCDTVTRYDPGKCMTWSSACAREAVVVVRSSPPPSGGSALQPQAFKMRAIVDSCCLKNTAATKVAADSVRGCHIALQEAPNSSLALESRPK